MSKEQVKKCIVAGDRFAEKKEWEKAIASYEEALEHDPTDKDVHERIVRTYINKKDRHGYLEALKRYNKMKASPPKKSASGKDAAPAEETGPVVSVDADGGFEEELPVLKSPPPKKEEPVKAQTQKAQTQKAETSKAEAPKAESPKTEEPKFEIPKSEKTKAEKTPVREPAPVEEEPPIPVDAEFDAGFEEDLPILKSSQPKKEEPVQAEELSQEPKPLELDAPRKDVLKPFSPAEILRKEPQKPQKPPAREIPPAKPEPQEQARPAAEKAPSKPAAEKPAKPAVEKSVLPFQPMTPAAEKAREEKPAAPGSEAETAEAEARQLERSGKKEPASKAYIQAARLWEQKGDKEKAGIAYEKSYDLSPSMDLLSKLNELYGQGVKLKQSTVMEIYRRIYHMKV